MVMDIGKNTFVLDICLDNINLILYSFCLKYLPYRVRPLTISSTGRYKVLAGNTLFGHPTILFGKDGGEDIPVVGVITIGIDRGWG